MTVIDVGLYYKTEFLKILPMYFAPSVTAACCAKLPFNTATLKKWWKTSRFFIIDQEYISLCALLMRCLKEVQRTMAGIIFQMVFPALEMIFVLLLLSKQTLKSVKPL